MRLFFLTGILMAFCIATDAYAAGDKAPELGPEIRAGLRAGQSVILLRHALALVPLPL